LWKAKREAKFPMLAANAVVSKESKSIPFGQYIIKNVAGVRVAIVGFVTPGIPHWEIPDHYRGYTFDLIPEAAKRIIPEVRKKADLVVVIAHSGYERDPDRPAPTNVSQGEVRNENAMIALAEQVPQIDVILFGHTHSEVKERIINGVLLTQARN